MPYKLTQETPKDTSNIYMVIYGKTIVGSLNADELAPHIGMLIGGQFADFQSFGAVGDYTSLYSTPWYWDTGIASNPGKDILGKIETLTAKWGKSLGNVSNHSKWPYNCRSFVAYVLVQLLGITQTKFAGLGKEIADAKSVALLKNHGDSLLNPKPETAAQ